MSKTACNDLEMFGCKDCGICTLCISEYYMVTDEVWEAAGLDKGMVCIACLEARIGKTLTATDFTDCPLNIDSGWARSDKLASRLAS